MKWLAYRYLKARGWSFRGQLPDIPKMIVIGAPHTSNWDFILFLAALHHYRIKARYIGKHTLFRWPFGYFFRAVGGIPVDRSKPGGIVGQVAAAFDDAERMILVIAPEGTRRLAPFWKSGFLKIAEATGAPLVLAGVDYRRKQVAIGPTASYEGDPVAFMDLARDFYADKAGLHPELKGPVAVKGEPSRGS